MRSLCPVRRDGDMARAETRESGTALAYNVHVVGLVGRLLRSSTSTTMYVHINLVI